MYITPKIRWRNLGACWLLQLFAELSGAELLRDEAEMLRYSTGRHHVVTVHRKYEVHRSNR